MSKPLVLLSVALGAAFLFLAWVYWSMPANTLPTYLPGYDASVATVHFKHGLGALVVALGLFILAWFGSGKKK